MAWCSVYVFEQSRVRLLIVPQRHRLCDHIGHLGKDSMSISHSELKKIEFAQPLSKYLRCLCNAWLKHLDLTTDTKLAWITL